MENNIFDRTQGADEISAKSFNMVIGLTLFWGFFINYIIVKTVDTTWIASINPIIFFLLYFASCFIGIKMYSSSDQPLISFIGYNFVVVPFGFIVNIVVSQFAPGVVLNAIIITGGVTLIMMALGTMFPAFFQKISGALFIALIAVIIVELVMIFIFKTHTTIIDIVVALIFCGYIGYDWGRANQMPKTVDNAIDGAAAIYMDIINLFLRVLRILGRSRD